MTRSTSTVTKTLLPLLLVVCLSSPLHAGTRATSSEEVLATLRQRIEGLRGYAVTIRHTKKNGKSLKHSVVRYESWGPSLTIRIRFLEGEKAGIEALYTAAEHRVKVNVPHLPVPFFINADDFGGDRRIYETHLGALIAQLDDPGWEVAGLNRLDSVDWPAWALTMVNHSLDQRVVLVVDQRQWLPTRIELFGALSSDSYEVWNFEDYRVDPPSPTEAMETGRPSDQG